jgi:hypothetical protein
MRARYTGDSDSITLFGTTFPKGVFVPVEGDHAQKKIAGNRFFEIEGGDIQDVEFTETQASAEHLTRRGRKSKQ